MAIHLDHNRKRKGLTQEDLPNIPSASHSRAAEGCAEFQCVLPRPMLISMPVPLLGWISPREGPLLPQSPQGLKLCWALSLCSGRFILFSFWKTQAQSPASTAWCWELQSPDFYVHFSLYCFACCVPGAAVIFSRPCMQPVSKGSVCLSVPQIWARNGIS